MNGDPHSHDEPRPAAETPVDAGSQALSEALRSSFAIVKFVMFFLIVAFLASGFFQVGPQERAIILRFGKPVGEGQKALLGPGLHWSFPFPIDDHQSVSVSGLQQVESTAGWYFMTRDQELAWRSTGAEPPPLGTLNPARDGYAITGDSNIVHIRATLFYRIEDPLQYVFGFVDASNVVQNTLNSAMLETAAHYKVDDILTRDVAGFRDAITRRVSELLDQQKVGVAVDHCEIDRIPPRQQSVRAAFLGLLNAENTRSKLLSDARSAENQITNNASATAASLINNAELDRARLVNELSSAATNFTKILPLYEANPALFVQQRFSETIARAFTNAEKWGQPAAVGGKSIQNWLLLNRELTVQTNR